MIEVFPIAIAMNIGDGIDIGEQWDQIIRFACDHGYDWRDCAAICDLFDLIDDQVTDWIDKIGK